MGREAAGDTFRGSSLTYALAKGKECFTRHGVVGGADLPIGSYNKDMAQVWIPALLRNLTRGQETLQVTGASVRQVIDNLDALCPGIKDRLCSGGELRRGLAVAIDAQLAQGGLDQAVADGSEVHFVPAISGGA